MMISKIIIAKTKEIEEINHQVDIKSPFKRYGPKKTKKKGKKTKKTK